MLKNISRLEVTIADKQYSFDCAPDSSIEHVKNALNAFIAYAVQIEQIAIEMQKKETEKAEQEKLVSDEPPIEG